jgi:hypothetical protein
MSIGDLPMRRIRERGALGHFRISITILTGYLQSQFSVLSLSLGQSLPPRVLSEVGCSRGLGCLIFYKYYFKNSASFGVLFRFRFG